MTEEKLRRESLMAAGTAVLIVVGNCAYVSYFLGFLHGPQAVLEGDHLHYIVMAMGKEAYKTLALAHDPPYCYRLLTPWLVYTLTQVGLTVNAAFYLVSQTFITLFLFTLYQYLRLVGVSFSYALLGMLLAGLLPGAVRWYAYQYWMTDPIALFLVVLGLWLIKTGRSPMLHAISCLAVTVRESFILVFCFYFLYMQRREGWQSAVKRTIVLVAVPFTLFFMIRYYVISEPVDPRLDQFRVIERLTWRVENAFNNQLYFATLGSFGVLLPLLLLFPKHLFKYFKRHYEEFSVVLFVYASLAVGGNTDRLLVYALPVLLPVALRHMRYFVFLSRISFAWTAAAVVALQLLHFFVTKFFGVPQVSINQPFNLAMTLSAIAFFLIGQAVLLLRVRKRAALST